MTNTEKTRFEIATEYITNKYKENKKELLKTMSIPEWKEFISIAIGKTPETIRDTTKLLELRGWIIIHNGQITIQMGPIIDKIIEIDKEEVVSDV